MSRSLYQVPLNYSPGPVIRLEGELHHLPPLHGWVVLTTLDAHPPGCIVELRWAVRQRTADGRQVPAVERSVRGFFLPLGAAGGPATGRGTQVGGYYVSPGTGPPPLEPAPLVRLRQQHPNAPRPPPEVVDRS